MGYSLTLVSLLQAFIMLTSQTIQGLYLPRAAFYNTFTWLDWVPRLTTSKKTSTLFSLASYFCSWVLSLLFIQSLSSSIRPCVSYLGPHEFFPGFWGDPTSATLGNLQRFRYFIFVRGGRGEWNEGGGVIHQFEDLILSRFLSREAHARSWLGRIGKGARGCVKSHIISGKGLTLKHCGVETHGSQKWSPLDPEEALLIPGGGDIIFINSLF